MIPLCEFYLMTVSMYVCSMHINLLFPQAESKVKEENPFSRFESFVSKTYSMWPRNQYQRNMNKIVI